MQLSDIYPCIITRIKSAASIASPHANARFVAPSGRQMTSLNMKWPTSNQTKNTGFSKRKVALKVLLYALFVGHSNRPSHPHSHIFSPSSSRMPPIPSLLLLFSTPQLLWPPRVVVQQQNTCTLVKRLPTTFVASVSPTLPSWESLVLFQS